MAMQLPVKRVLPCVPVVMVLTEYTVLALESFRSGARANDLNKMMRMVAERLSDKEISALGNYVQGLH